MRFLERLLHVATPVIRKTLQELLAAECYKTATAAVKVPPASPWTAFNSAYSRAVGPPPSMGMDTITVPYMPKSPFFPKFVDPKSMITKKTDMLSTLFGGLGPVIYTADSKPFVPYSAPYLSSTDIGSSVETGKSTSILPEKPEKGTVKEDAISAYKRGIFGPFSPKFGPMGGISPMGPKFGPIPPFAAPDTVSNYSPSEMFSRKRRSLASLSTNDVNTMSEDSELEENTLSEKEGSSTPVKEYMPGMFGPFGPVVDPAMFISKKSAFLDTLFKNIATSTTETPLDASTLKSTIVPPSFWIPSSSIPDPTEYNDKVLTFLDKLFENIKINKTTTADNVDSKDVTRSLSNNGTQVKIARAVQDLSSITNTKDMIVDSILSELGDIKGNMITTLNDLIAYEKTMAPATTPKKPFKPFAPGLWPKPTVDPTLPFKQRMIMLGQMFDMLTDLQKNITLAIQETIKTNTVENTEAESTTNPPINMTLLDAIKKKLDTVPSINYAIPMKVTPKISRMLPKDSTSFWVNYPDSTVPTAKRDVNDISYLPSTDNDDLRHQEQRQYQRAVKMQMHQGYQSLPAGAIETVQAGGGSTPEHQGGGIKLLNKNEYADFNKWMDWIQYFGNDQQEHRHSHNHH
ncbi:hypothetical protein KM043_010686 [Ampulex compressa]|nr:hypothetical protein KM043_010686 [Ampulex compressa]